MTLIALLAGTQRPGQGQIHGNMSGVPLGAVEARYYAQILAANAVELAARVRPGDVVLLHDPQTAGLAAPLVQAGARVVWRCHIGVDWEDEVTRAGWDCQQAGGHRRRGPPRPR